jgi:hypothetical protein
VIDDVEEVIAIHCSTRVGSSDFSLGRLSTSRRPGSLIQAQVSTASHSIGAFKIEVASKFGAGSIPVLAVQSTSLLPLIVECRILCLYCHHPHAAL